MTNTPDPARKALGRGLSALIPQKQQPSQISPPPSTGALSLPLDQIQPNPLQPRDVFDPERLSELAQSIRENGIIQPIIVRRAGEGYQLIAGERRWRAAKLAMLSHVPAVIQDFADDRLMDITLIGELDGIETAQRIHKTNMIPVVFLTASTDTGTFERAKITEDSEYVIKPFTDNDLHIAIEMAYYKHGLSRKIQKKQKFFEDLLMQSRQGIIATDKEGFITLSNPVAEQVTGRHHFTTKKMQFSEMVIIQGTDGQVINDPLRIVRETLKVWDIPEHAQLL
ncbi:MAG TPA: ParB/RepB/Spo0J family partition protein, partial [Bryobacteraceae bacterium]|nr:ParB/RepB/Spo0J family partition protein [Bryobacteraceae bacterium]